MTISKKVATGMLVGALAGLLGSTGGMLYFGYHADKLHPTEQVIVELKDSFNECAYSRNETACGRWKQQYSSLESELTHLEADSSYQQFLDDRKRNKALLYGSLALFSLSLLSYLVGDAARWRREDEEFKEDFERIMRQSDRTVELARGRALEAQVATRKIIRVVVNGLKPTDKENNPKQYN